uniref:LITAF domain-containing protein n=1 Tax=Glossina pallidipes TaxID=7398 RepID=A0A1A9ZYN9_GLOPL
MNESTRKLLTALISWKSQMPIIVSFGPEPQELRCPRCKREVTTLLRGRTTYVTHFVALLVLSAVLTLYAIVPSGRSLLSTVSGSCTERIDGKSSYQFQEMTLYRIQIPEMFV